MKRTISQTGAQIPIRRAVLLALPAAVGAGLWVPATTAQEWSNPGTGDWFDPANWNPAAVPVAGSNPIVSNSGTAKLSGVVETPVLGSLNVGQGGSGTGIGAVSSDGVKIRAGTFSIGTVFSSGNFGEGDLVITGAGAESGSANVGVIVSPVGTSTAIGHLTVDGALPLTGGFLQVGQMFGSGRGSQADGVLSIGGDAGTVGGFFIVGNVTSTSDAQVGSTSSGELTVSNGGGLALAGSNVYVGTTLGAGRVVEGADTFIDRATGTAAIAGTLAFTGSPGFFGIGYTTGGIAEGTLTAGALDMGTNRISTLNVGISTSGDATGRLAAGGGDLLVTGGAVVGRTNTGNAQGAVQLGGQLQGSGSGALLAGYAFGAGGSVVNATGTVEAAGVSGFTQYNVGVLSGEVGAGSVAQGTVNGVGAGVDSGPTNTVNVGVLVGTENQATAIGHLTVDGALPLTGGFLQVGQMFDSGRGSQADGVLSIGGDAGTVGGFFIVGNVTSTSDAQVGSTSSGELTVSNGGGLALAGSNVYVGTTLGAGRVVEGADTFIDRATGTAAIAGTLAFTGSPGFFGVGYTTGGIAEGTLTAGALDMGTSRISTLNVGISTSGDATGRLAAGGGSLRADTVLLGSSYGGGTADGTLALLNTVLEADNVAAGIGSGTAQLELTDSQGMVAMDFALQSGTLSLERSLLDVGDQFTLGDAASLLIAIEGAARGDAYGAINAAVATLAGDLQVDFSKLLPSSDTMVFDLLRSGSSDGISGDFASFSYTGLLGGYSVLAGIELDGIEVYRLRLFRSIEVPEPGTLGLLLLSLGTLGAFGRGARRRC